MASSDLSDDVLALLETYGSNDDVIFFLGRLVWLGKMTDCAADLEKIAVDKSRGRYARVAAIRGVMAVGNAEQKDRTWVKIADEAGPLDHLIIAELLDWDEPTCQGVELLLRALQHAASFRRFNTSGLDHALHEYIERLPVMDDGAHEHPLADLIEGLDSFLRREPYTGSITCRVSKEFSWLMPMAIHAIDKLVAARSKYAFTPAAIRIMENVSILREEMGYNIKKYKDSLAMNVPRWHQLNDLLYWTSISNERERLKYNGTSLLSDWQIGYAGHFWGFGAEDFERCLGWINTKEGDDRIIALTRCIALYIEADRPAPWLVRLNAAVADDVELKATLDAALDPKLPLAAVNMYKEHSEQQRCHKRRLREQQKERANWVQTLKADPSRVYDRSGLKPGEISVDQKRLVISCMSESFSKKSSDAMIWKALIPEFGGAVAHAYRNAAVAHWRHYQPQLRSEGAHPSFRPDPLVFGIMGLAIEAEGNDALARKITTDEAQIASRYAMWQINDLPAWFEHLFRVFSDIALDIITQELTWELNRSITDRSPSNILYNVLYHAPWLHKAIAPKILDWLLQNEMQNPEELRYCLNILGSGGISPASLAMLAAKKVQNTLIDGFRPRWYALWVDTAPETAIPALESALEALSVRDASTFAQQFAVGLLSDRHGTGARTRAYHNVRDLKTLYALMYRFIPEKEDINRAGTGVYSPTLRDDAQEARNALLNMLVELPGSESYVAIKALEKHHPELSRRPWMGMLAYRRATLDADEPAWSEKKVYKFTNLPPGNALEF